MAENPATAVRLAGINQAGLESENGLMTQDRTLPWLQDTAEANVWGAWAVAFRDVVILDRDNRRARVYNLNDHDLRNPANKAELKAMLKEVAGE